MKLRAIFFIAALSSVSGATFVVTTVDAQAAPLSAEDKKAAKAFADGQAAFEAGDFRRAAGLFESAYAAKPHHSALWNAAKSWQRAGEDLTAVNLLERYLKEAPTDAANRAEANQALATIEKHVGRIQLQIVTVSNAALDGNPAKEGLSYVAPGEHVLTADDQGKTMRKVVPVKAGEIVSVTLAHEEPVKPKVIVVEKVVPAKPLSPWFVLGGGVLTAGAGAATIYFGLQTLKQRDDVVNAGQHDQNQINEANSTQLKTNIALGATIGLAVITAAVAIFFVDWHPSKKEEDKPTAFRVGPGGVSF